MGFSNGTQPQTFDIGTEPNTVFAETTGDNGEVQTFVVKGKGTIKEKTWNKGDCITVLGDENNQISLPQDSSYLFRDTHSVILPKTLTPATSHT